MQFRAHGQTNASHIYCVRNGRAVSGTRTNINQSHNSVEAKKNSQLYLTFYTKLKLPMKSHHCSC